MKYLICKERYKGFFIKNKKYNILGAFYDSDYYIIIDELGLTSYVNNIDYSYSNNEGKFYLFYTPYELRKIKIDNLLKNNNHEKRKRI